MSWRHGPEFKCHSNCRHFSTCVPNCTNYFARLSGCWASFCLVVTLSPRERTPWLLNGSANVLIWGLKFGGREIIWSLKFQGPICAIYGLKFRVGEIIWDLIFLVCHCPSHFASIRFFSEQDGWLFGVFENLGLIVWGFEKIASH